MRLEDTLVNLLSGMGTDKDKAQAAGFQQKWLSKWELDSMYQTDWLAGAMIDCPCDDLTREWRTWEGGPNQRAAMMRTERKLRVRHVINFALKMARLYGGSAILIGDGAADPSVELDVAKIAKGGIQYLHVLSRYEIWSALIDRDPISPYFGEPSYYTLVSPGSLAENAYGVQNQPGHGAVRIHPSRVVRFLGQAHLEITTTWDGWGLPTLQRSYDAIRNVGAAAQNLAAMTYEAKLDIIKIPGMTQNIMSIDYQSKLLTRFAMANKTKSTSNALVLDAEEDWEQKQIGFANFPEVIRIFLEMAAGAADIPLTRLLGTTAKGLNNDGGGDLRNYYDMLRARQETELRPGLERLDMALKAHSGVGQDEMDFDWVPLWQIREDEKAAIEMQAAQRDAIYGASGAFPPSAIRKGIQNALIAAKTYPGLEEAIEAAGDEACEPLVTPPQVQAAGVAGEAQVASAKVAATASTKVAATRASKPTSKA